MPHKGTGYPWRHFAAPQLDEGCGGQLANFRVPGCALCGGEPYLAGLGFPQAEDGVQQVLGHVICGHSTLQFGEVAAGASDLIQLQEISRDMCLELEALGRR